ncbi:MAG: VTT domain-containing protein [Proteobacteria bacterium]|jgi:undecaprenyl-diphosphatase|nr:VTT domain-containing protein [Pseudomonadota bacterium]
MDSTFLTALLDWLQQHTIVSLIIVFLVALGESLAFVGLLVPGAVLMVGFGALIALGYLPFWPTVLSAVLGAVAGDGLSYWLGAYYNQRLAAMWPFTRYPGLLERGQTFFTRHGGKSVLLGRFFGPLRPIIPAIAGMMAMPLRKFILVNVLSALFWAPLYLLPGILFGTALELASEFAGRFTLLLVSLLVLLWLLAWLVKRIYLWLVPLTDAIMLSVLNWSRRHPLAGEIPAAIISPTHAEVRGLSLLALILLLATSGFIVLSQTAGHLPIVHNVDRLVYHALHALHNPLFDHAMVLIGSLGDTILLSLVAALVMLFLLQQRQWLAVWHWLAAFLFPLLLVILLHFLYVTPGPPGMNLPDRETALSGHAILSVAVYGFLAIVLVRDAPPRYHLPIYLLATLLVLLITFARLYLGAQWLSNLLGGLLLGLAWTALLGIAYRRHARQASLTCRHCLIPAALLVVVMLAYPPLVHQSQLARFQPPPQEYVMSKTAWLDSGWQVIPARRQDLRGVNEFPFNLQWRGTAITIGAWLQDHGWQQPEERFDSYLNWLNPTSSLAALPLLPHVHAGEYEQFRWIRLTGENGLYVIRLWPSHIEVTDGSKALPLWYGNVTRLRKAHNMGLTYLVTARDFHQPLQWFRQQPDLARTVYLAERTRTDMAPPQPVLLLDNGQATRTEAD